VVEYERSNLSRSCRIRAAAFLILAHWRASNFISVEKAVEAGKLANIPVMVDFGYFLPERQASAGRYHNVAQGVHVDSDKLMSTRS
jgi:hypothetical protein